MDKKMLKGLIIFNLIVMVLLFPGWSYSQARETAIPVRDLAEVGTNISLEEVLQLKKAKIAILDYQLLRTDFPFLKTMSESEIDEWILSEVAYMAKPQVDQTVVNSEIPVNGFTRQGHRPPSYGRAMVFVIKSPENGEHIGLIDVKGSGSLKPAQASHGNGLATLGEALREYNYEHMVRKVLRDAKVPHRTVGSYGVIDAGFDVIHEDGSRSRAGLYLRQGHSRSSTTGWLDNETRRTLRNIFERYGIYTGFNIQGSSRGDLFDFGHYVVRHDLGRVGEKLIPVEQWGFTKRADIAFDYSKLDRPWVWAHETAEAFAQGRATRADILKHHHDLLDPVFEILTDCNSYLLVN
jgi:hypothetical protein